MGKPLSVCLLFLFLITSHGVRAQKEAVNWYFGIKAGLNFNQENPVPLTNGAINSYYATAIISDKKTGELLFYSNGRNVWNRFHQRMPGSNEFPEDCYSPITQSALIVPVPGNEHQYYLFTIRFTYSNLDAPLYGNCDPAIYYDALLGFPGNRFVCELRYSVVDMRLDNGKGDIVNDQKNILLQENVTGKLTAIPHTNGKDYWVLTHAWNSDAFYVFPVTTTGISTPLTQHIGSEHKEVTILDEPQSGEITGELKASPDGKKLASAVGLTYQTRPFDLFDFDAATGTISNYINLGDMAAPLSVSFSPDNSKLYVSVSANSFANPNSILQYDLSAGSTELIKASAINLTEDNPYSNLAEMFNEDEGFHFGDIGLQLAPDGKIYATGDSPLSVHNVGKALHRMIIIHKPNAAGYACQINYTDFEFGKGRVGVGLPNFIQSYFNGLEPVANETDNACSSKNIIIYPNPTKYVVNIKFEGSCSPSYQLNVFNSVGQVLYQQNNLSVQEIATINMAKWADGMYLFRFSSPNSTISKKVLKLSGE